MKRKEKITHTCNMSAVVIPEFSNWSFNEANFSGVNLFKILEETNYVIFLSITKNYNYLAVHEVQKWSWNSNCVIRFNRLHHFIFLRHIPSPRTPWNCRLRHNRLLTRSSNMQKANLQLKQNLAIIQYSTLSMLLNYNLESSPPLELDPLSLVQSALTLCDLVLQT